MRTATAQACSRVARRRGRLLDWLYHAVAVSSSATPHLSVVVTVVDGGDALERLLRALGSQASAPPLEVIVPFDATIADVGQLSRRFPQVRFLDLGALPLAHAPTTGAGRHELFDLRRAAGLAEATGALVGMLEDRAPPAPDWAAVMTRLHAELPHAVIGGPIASTAPDALNWAFYACDFTRYAPPQTSGPRDFVSDVNICYKRRALAATRALWSHQYNEVQVHWALVRAGETLYLNHEPLVYHRATYASLTRLVAERFDWGRLFGAVRAGEVGAATRLVLIGSAPIVPLVLLARLGRAHARLGSLRRFLGAVPVIVALQVAWVAGETWGYVTRRS